MLPDEPVCWEELEEEPEEEPDWLSLWELLPGLSLFVPLSLPPAELSDPQAASRPRQSAAASSSANHFFFIV